MPALSISTCWNSARHSDGYAMVGEILDLGFDRIELSHGTRLTLVAGIVRAVEEGLTVGGHSVLEGLIRTGPFDG